MSTDHIHHFFDEPSDIQYGMAYCPHCENRYWMVKSEDDIETVKKLWPEAPHFIILGADSAVCPECTTSFELPPVRFLEWDITLVDTWPEYIELAETKHFDNTGWLTGRV